MKYKNSVYKSFVMITQLGISMLAPIFLCTFLGMFLENKFSAPVTVPLLILGILAGGRNMYILAKSAVPKPEKEDEDDEEENEPKE